jgi:hypothetical protein
LNKKITVNEFSKSQNVRKSEQNGFMPWQHQQLKYEKTRLGGWLRIFPFAFEFCGFFREICNLQKAW